MHTGGRSHSVVMLLAPALLFAVACDGSGEYDGGVPLGGGGSGGGGITAAQIGTTCSYDYDGRNPDNDCGPGLACFIFTGDNAHTTGLTRSAWEDQMTVYLGGRDNGYCTLVGTVQSPPSCPAGTALKVFSPDVTACLRVCSQPADCGRADYTCDDRYYDLVEPGTNRLLKTCVKECTYDLPDCVRSGVISPRSNPGTLVATVAFEDLAGASMCDVPTGLCTFVPESRGTAGPGEPCTDTSQCEAGSACIHGDIIGAVLRDNPGGLGFCASPCTPVEPGTPQQSNCSTGYVCQYAGSLNFGWPDLTVVDLNLGNMDQRGGFCFHQCAAGVEASCSGIPGTGCASLDETAAGAAWNGVPMCLPAALGR